jgi:glycosyltransferase involved in cell wall biosynthesis
MKIHYITYYVGSEKIDILEGSLAADAKIEYLAERLSEKNIVKVISIANFKQKLNGSQKRFTIVRNNVEYIYFSSYGANTLFTKILRKIKKIVSLVHYIFFEINKDDVIIIYHSLNDMYIVRLLTKLKRVKVILQVEEIYSLAYIDYKKKYNSEIKHISSFKNHFFINSYVRNILKISGINIIYYGAYKKYDMIKSFNHKSNQIIKIVYAGVIEKTRNAAFIAANTAKYLPSNYELHIAGFGSKADINELKALIKNINTALSAKIIYDGAISGEKFHHYLASHDIGINCHTYEHENLLSSQVTFPSKIVSYLSHGLKVVTNRIDVITESPFNELVEYYDGFSDEEIARTIKKISISDKKTTEIFNSLDYIEKDFISNLNQMMRNLL